MDFLSTSNASYNKAALTRKKAALHSLNLSAQSTLRASQTAQKIEDERIKIKRTSIISKLITSITELNEMKLSLPGVDLKVSLKPYPVHGIGDKITLPPSVLDGISSVFNDPGNLPLMFRVGILRDADADGDGSGDGKGGVDAVKVYDDAIKASGLVEHPSLSLNLPNNNNGSNSNTAMDDEDSDSENEEEEETNLKAFTSHVIKSHLSSKYSAYTHSGIIEFTAPEGYVGIPLSLALLLRNGDDGVNISRPESVIVDGKDGKGENGEDGEDDDEEEQDQMLIDGHPVTMDGVPLAADGTPMYKLQNSNNPAEELTSTGAPAYDKFNVPDCELYVQIVKLPKAEMCTLTPTIQALKNGFVTLSDIKLVLEQSLQKSRTTISIGDEVSVFDRGVEYAMTCDACEPGFGGGVCLIDCNVEVQIGRNSEMDRMEEEEKVKREMEKEIVNDVGGRGGGVEAFKGVGHTLSSSSSSSSSSSKATSKLSTPQQQQLNNKTNTILQLEPTEGGVTIMIRTSSSGSHQRKFDTVTSTLVDVYKWVETFYNASASENGGVDGGGFVLVSRMPRVVYTKEGGRTLGEMGIEEMGRMALFVESI